jgi:hypothetical protein
MNYISPGNGTNLCVFSVKPAASRGYQPLIFVPGMASVIETFSIVVKELTEKFELHYIETREKRSSELSGDEGFGVRDIASDLSGVVEKLAMEDGNYILVAYSLAATASAESFAGLLKIKPSLLLLAAPSAEFRIPPFGHFAAKYLYRAYSLIKPLIKLYLRLFVIDAVRDHEMYMISVRAVDAADARKLSRTLLAIAGYKIWNSLDSIDVPTIVIGTSDDTLHNLDDATRISALIKDSVYIDLKTNDRSHSKEVSDLIEEKMKGNIRKKGS